MVQQLSDYNNSTYVSFLHKKSVARELRRSPITLHHSIVQFAARTHDMCTIH